MSENKGPRYIVYIIMEKKSIWLTAEYWIAAIIIILWWERE